MSKINYSKYGSRAQLFKTFPGLMLKKKIRDDFVYSLRVSLSSSRKQKNAHETKAS